MPFNTPQENITIIIIGMLLLYSVIRAFVGVCPVRAVFRTFAKATSDNHHWDKIAKPSTTLPNFEKDGRFKWDFIDFPKTIILNHDSGKSLEIHLTKGQKYHAVYKGGFIGEPVAIEDPDNNKYFKGLLLSRLTVHDKKEKLEPVRSLSNYEPEKIKTLQPKNRRESEPGLDLEIIN